MKDGRVSATDTSLRKILERREDSDDAAERKVVDSRVRGQT